MFSDLPIHRLKVYLMTSKSFDTCHKSSAEGVYTVVSRQVVGKLLNPSQQIVFVVGKYNLDRKRKK